MKGVREIRILKAKSNAFALNTSDLEEAFYKPGIKISLIEGRASQSGCSRLLQP